MKLMVMVDPLGGASASDWSSHVLLPAGPMQWRSYIHSAWPPFCQSPPTSYDSLKSWGQVGDVDEPAGLGGAGRRRRAGLAPR